MQQAQIEKTAKVKFATQADPAVLQTLKSIAASEGRQIQALVDEALRGKGIGSKMIAAVHEKYNNAARFRLEVTEENPRAAALYHILGFEDLPYQQMVMDTPALD